MYAWLKHSTQRPLPHTKADEGHVCLAETEYTTPITTYKG